MSPDSPHTLSPLHIEMSRRTFLAEIVVEHRARVKVERVPLVLDEFEEAFDRSRLEQDVRIHAKSERSLGVLEDQIPASGRSP